MSKKVLKEVIAVYNSDTNEITSLRGITANGDDITYVWSGGSKIKGNNFQDLYLNVILLINATNRYMKHYKQFGLNWFPIDWIDLSPFSKDYGKISRYGLSFENSDYLRLD